MITSKGQNALDAHLLIESVSRSLMSLAVPALCHSVFSVLGELQGQCSDGETDSGQLNAYVVLVQVMRVMRMKRHERLDRTLGRALVDGLRTEWGRAHLPGS